MKQMKSVEKLTQGISTVTNKSHRKTPSTAKIMELDLSGTQKLDSLQDSFRAKLKEQDNMPSIKKAVSTRGYNSKATQNSERSGANLTSYQQKRATYKAA